MNDTDTPKKLSLKSNIFGTYPGQVLLLALALAVTYGNSINVPFYLDDFDSITDNPYIKNLSDLAGLWHYAKTRIVGYWTFAVNFHFHNTQVSGYHIVNILIHYLAGLASFAFVRLAIQTTPAEKHLSTAEKRWLPFFVALLFVIHPLQTQAVTYTVQRLASLAAFFYIASMACYTKARLDNSRAALWFAATAVFAGLAFFSKQNSATLPLALLAVEFTFFRADRKTIAVSACIVLGITLAGYLALGLMANLNPFNLDTLTNMTAATNKISREQYLATQTSVVFTYIRLFFWPVGQHLDWNYPLASGLTEFPVILRAMLHTTIFASSLFYLRRFPLIAFGICFYYLALVVESSIIPIPDVFFEHRTYLPNLGLSLAAASFFMELSRRWPKKATGATIAIICIILVTAAWKRNQIWNDEIAFWQDNINKSPMKARSYLNLGKAYTDRGDIDNAVIAYKKAVNVNPDYAIAHSNLGVMYMKLKDNEKAILHLQQAALIQPNYPEVYNNIGTLFSIGGQYEKAVEAFRLAIKYNPHYAKARMHLSQLLFNLGNREEAEQQLRMAIDSAPAFAQAYEKLAFVLQSRGKLDEAVFNYKQAVRYDPALLNSYYNLGIIYSNKREHQQAIEAFKMVIQLNPRFPGAHNAVGGNMLALGRVEEAVKYLSRSLELYPNDPGARRNLDIARMELSRRGTN